MIEEFDDELKRIAIDTKEYNSANVLSLAIGKIESDGDWGHGGRSYIKITDLTSTCAMIRITDITGNSHLFDIGEWQSIEILAGGECERTTFSNLFEDVGKYLKDGRHKP
jgi:hypothetical protein